MTRLSHLLDTDTCIYLIRRRSRETLHRQLEALLDQLLNSDVHEVSRIVHREGRLGHRLPHRSPGVLFKGLHTEIPANGVPVALARAG